MKVFPSVSFELETTRDVAELVGLLGAETRPAPLGIPDRDLTSDLPLMSLTFKDTVFIGDVTNEGFELCRNVRYSNASRPHLFGAFRRSEAGTIININVCLTRASKVLLSLIALVLPLAGFLDALIDKEMGVAFFLFLMAFVGLVYAGTWYSVHVEAGEGRRTLEAICRSPEHAL